MPANVCEHGEPLSLHGRGKAVDELREERETLVAGAGDAPGRPSLILRLGLKGVGEANGQEVLQERGVGEGEVIPAAGQEGRGAEVLLPLVRHTLLVVQFHVWVGVEEFEHPFFHPACRPCSGSRAPDLPGQVGHELDFVLGNQGVLAFVAPEPLAHEAFVQVDRPYLVPDA